MIDIIYRAVVSMVKAIGNIKGEIVLKELCDFGDSFGFLFLTPDKFQNQYWCVDKKTYKPFIFTENQDIEKYKKRKIMKQTERKVKQWE